MSRFGAPGHASSTSATGLVDSPGRALASTPSTPGGRLGAPGLACDGGAVESGFGSIGPAALHAGFLARGVVLTAQLDELLLESAVLFLVSGTQVVDPLLTVHLFAFGVVNRRVVLGGHRRQLPHRWPTSSRSSVARRSACTRSRRSDSTASSARAARADSASIRSTALRERSSASDCATSA